MKRPRTQPAQPRQLTHGSLCTGYGGLDMAVESVFGSRLAWWSDVEPGPIAVMQHHHPGVPNLGDLKAAGWHEAEPVDILTAGYPCQPFSNAGKRLGTDDPRHLWPYIAYAVGVLRPSVIVLENVAAHLRRGFPVVVADLAALGYDAAWTVVRASDVGAPHERKRLFVVAAHADSGQRHRWQQDALRVTQPRTVVARRGGSGHRRATASDAARERVDRSGYRRAGGRLEPTDRGVVATHADDLERARERVQQPGRASAAVDRSGRLDRWGEYAEAVDRWERVFGRAHPDPTAAGARGTDVLNPALVEWMQGLPAGHVTAVPGLTRNQMLKLLGNGVVPQQAEYALRQLVPVLLGPTELEAAS